MAQVEGVAYEERRVRDSWGLEEHPWPWLKVERGVRSQGRLCPGAKEVGKDQQRMKWGKIPGI